MKKFIFLIICWLGIVGIMHCQNKSLYEVPLNEYCKSYYDSNLKKDVFISFTDPPIPPNGIAYGYMNYIYQNLQISVEELIKQYRHAYELIIDENGKILTCIPYYSNWERKDEKDYTLLDKEVFRILNESPKWTPAKCLKTNITAKISFSLVQPRLQISNKDEKDMAIKSGYDYCDSLGVDSICNLGKSEIIRQIKLKTYNSF